MRRSLTLLVALILAALSQVSMQSYAAVSVQVTGQLGSMPNATVLCLMKAAVSGVSTPNAQALIASPCPSGQTPIYIVHSTQIVNHNGSPVSTQQLAFGDLLQVSGSLDGGHINAMMVKDITTQQNTTSLNGSLVSSPTTLDRAQPSSLLLQVGAQSILLQLTNRTLIIDRNSHGVSLGDLHPGASLRATGNFVGGQLFASVIRDYSLPAITIQVSGQLGSMPSSTLLCLTKAAVTGVSIPNALAPVTTPCPSGQTPIYIVHSTQIVNHNGSPISMGKLGTGDLIQVTGILTDGRINAQMVKDVTTQENTTSLRGTLVSSPTTLNRAQPSNLLLQVGAQTILIRVTSRTIIINHASHLTAINNLHPGATLRVTGNYVNGIFDASVIRDLSI